MGNYSTKRYSTIVDAGISGGASSYADVNSLPASPSQGDIALVTGTNKLYVYDGSNWFNIAIVNQAPTAISGNQASYELATDGTPTVVTLVSTDPEGFPLTWSATTSGDTQVGTVTNTDNVFTITPSTDEADEGTLSVTFSVTDGNNTETSFSSFTLAFISLLWDETVLSIGTSSTNSLDNSTFIDRSTNAHTITTVDTPVQTAFHPYLDNWSVDFDGNDYLSFANDPSLDLDTGDFTIEGWWYFTDTNNQAMISKYTAGAGYVVQYHYANLRLVLGLGGSDVVYNFPWEAVPHTWYHVAITRSGTDAKAFINGVQIGSTTTVTTSNVYTSNALQIGLTQTTAEYTRGSASNIRIVKGTALYTSAFAPPTEKLTAVSGTSLLTCQSNRFIDNSTNSHTVALGGNPVVSAFNPFGQESEYAAGENKGSLYVEADAIYTTSIDTSGEFTLELWFYATNAAGTLNEICKIGSGYLGSNNGISFRYRAGNLQMVVLIDDVYVTPLVQNQWYHVVAEKTSTSAVNFYINGVRVYEYSSAVNFTATSPLSIGTVENITWNNDFRFYGYISDLKVTNQLVYDALSYTVPTSPVGNTNSILYLPFDNAGVFDKTGNNELKLYGNTQTSSVVTKYGSTSLKFDGTQDIIMLNPGNWRYGDYTLELWAYFNSVSGNIYLIDHGGGNNGQLQYYAGSFGMSNSSGSLIVSEGGSPLSSGQWYHFAVTREGSTVRLFRDGVLKSTGTNSETYSDVQMCIGNTLYNGINSYSAWFNGYMQDIQILRGVAKYTTDFTPPDRTQGRTYQAES